LKVNLNGEKKYKKEDIYDYITLSGVLNFGGPRYVSLHAIDFGLLD
jgi:hypothetical protein